MYTVIFLLTVILPIAWWDIRKYRVPNLYIILGWVQGLVFQWNQSGCDGMVDWILGMMIPVILLWGLCRRHMFGAGDVKALSVVGGFFGISSGIPIWLASFVIGAIFSVIQVVRYHLLFDRLQCLATYLSKNKKEQWNTAYYHKARDGQKPVIPFSAAIGIAVCSQCIWRFWSAGGSIK